MIYADHSREEGPQLHDREQFLSLGWTVPCSVESEMVFFLLAII